MFDCVIIGDIFIDINVRADEITKGGVTECEEFICTPAGISNIAVALSLLNCKVAIIGKCGNDIFGNFFIEDIKNHKVTPYIVKSVLPTGLLISFVDSSAERSFIIARGSNNTLSINEVDKILSDLQYRYLYATGYSLTHSPQRDSIIYSMKMAKMSSAMTIFDPGSYNIIDRNYEYFINALKLTDILSCNLEEALALTYTREFQDTILNLTKIVPVSIIRLGRKGCIVCNRQDNVKYVPLQLRIKAKDTTGAGDAFTSALIYGLVRGWNLYKSAYFANLFAAKKVANMGARSFPSKKDIKKLIHMTETNWAIIDGEIYYSQ